eukprot:scaffold68194_cov58-Attheya_sp.AAC.2
MPGGETDKKTVTLPEDTRISKENDGDPQLQALLEVFTVRHASHHRPIALVTSGGTAVDLEVNAVRSLENFSTGLRGAVSVEKFLQRGYAVIHLMRTGSTAPYARVLSSLLEQQGNHGLSCDSLGRLFGPDPFEDDSYVDDNTNSTDPWLTEFNQAHSKSTGLGKKETSEESSGSDDDIRLSRRILNSTRMHRCLRERANVANEGLLMTVPFRTVDEYLSKLKICSLSLQDSRSLAIVYLAAAVSDFYIPTAKKSLHKIQSRNYASLSDSADEESSGSAIASDNNVVDDGSLSLKLYPVPKMIMPLRQTWAPNAFVVSFKLETDKTILYHKAMMAAKTYGVHMVIGNILATRHEKVFVLHKAGLMDIDENAEGVSKGESHLTKEKEFEFIEISKRNTASGTIDDLEDAMVGYVVERHFEFIATHFHQPDGNGAHHSMAGAEAAVQTSRHLEQRKREIQKELYRKRIRKVTLEVAGTAIGMGLTFWISAFLQNRILGGRR